MCFYNGDYDWYADVETREYVQAQTEGRCYECGRVIEPGEWREEFNQQEHDCCAVCESDFDDGLYDPEQDPKKCEHNYGESFSCTTCRECCLIIEAIYEVEEREGCPMDARRPCSGNLRETMQHDQAKWGDKKYTANALAMFPELSQSPLM